MCAPYFVPIIYNGNGYGLIYGNNGETYKYLYTGNAMTAGTAMKRSHSLFACAFGNATQGIVAGGQASPYLITTDKYTYANDTTVMYLDLTAGRIGASGCGNEAYGLVVSGFTGQAFLLTIDRFLHVQGTRTSGGTMTASSYQGHAFNAPTQGLLVIDNGTTTVKHTYATNVMVAGGATVVGRTYPAVFGTKEVGYACFAAGASATKSVYTYATDVGVSVSCLGTNRVAPVGMGNNTVGVISGGGIGSTTNTNALDVYNFASDTNLATTSITAITYYLSATSSLPGHL